MSSTSPSIAVLLREAQDTVRAFRVWWLGELRSFIPPRVQGFFAGDENHLRILALTNSLRIEGGPASNESWTLSLETGAEIPSALQAQFQGGAAATLIIPADVVLRRSIELPLAAASDLHAATSFLIERVTPFRFEQACHAARLLGHDRSRKLLRAELAVIARTRLEGLLAAVAAHQIRLSAVRIEGDSGKPLLDFLPQQQSRFQFRWKPREAWVPVLAAGLLALVLGPLGVVYRIHAQADALTGEVAQAASAAQRAAALRSEVEARAAAAAFMPTHQRWPRAIEVLDALTKALPDDTWIFRLEMRPGLVTFAGFSSNVPALLERFTASPLTTPELASPVVHGAANGKDRFELRVQLKASEP